MHALWADDSEADIALDDISLSATCFDTGDLFSTYTQSTSLLHPCQEQIVVCALGSSDQEEKNVIQLYCPVFS